MEKAVTFSKSASHLRARGRTMKSTFPLVVQSHLKRCLPVLAVGMVLSLFGMAQPCAATYLLITTDVCRAWGPDVKGQWQGKDYGLPLIVETLDRFGLKGTFFVSPYVPKGFEEEASATIRFIVSRGHDVQLHPHVEALSTIRDRLTDYSRQEKLDIIKRGVKLLEQGGAPHPVAHRAGAYAIDAEMLDLLPEAGIFIDSSIFPPDPRCKVTLPYDMVNRFVKVEKTYELPITLVQRVPFLGYRGMTALDLNRLIWPELEAALNQIAEHRVPVATFFMHYFSLYKLSSTYQDLGPIKVLGPDRDKIETLENVLRMVSTDKRFQVITVRELWNRFGKAPQEFAGPSFVPYTGIWLTYRKAWHDFWGHNLPNKIVALAPIVFILILACAVALVLRRRRIPPRN
jgi:hypothetical protein